MKKNTAKPSFDLNRLIDDFRGLDGNDPGVWPLAPRVAAMLAVLLLVVAGAWWFFWQDQMDQLAASEKKEVELKASWKEKKRQSVNLDAHLKQLAEIDRQFGALLKQLPNRAEMDSLLADINQAGIGRGLQFQLFKPGSETMRDFYAEMPIAINLTGNYHDLGAFAGDVAKMPRIVTLNNIDIERSKADEPLALKAQATTYRYLDDDELAARAKAAQANKKRK